MAFKVKQSKKVKTESKTTIDSRHTKKIHEINNNIKNNQSNKKKLSKLEEQLSLLNKKEKLADIDINKRIQLIDDINFYKTEIKHFDKKNENINYLLDNGNILFSYYDNKNKLADGKNVSINNFSKNVDNSNKSIIDYLLTDKKQITNEYNDKISLCEQYLSNVDDNYMVTKNINLERCQFCNVDKITYLSDGKLICSKCGDETEILIESNKPSYKDPPREVTYFSYKRINHFNEWLAQFQAKETTDIPKEIYEEIITEINKERIQLQDLNNKKLREILKKLKKNKYYEHIPHILNKLNGITPPTMTIEIEEELRRMFKEIQVPFYKFCPKNRKNFLSYSYVLHKFVQLLGLDEFKDCFILLKSREKLHQQDQIWKQICNHLNWDYYPSI